MGAELAQLPDEGFEHGLCLGVVAHRLIIFQFDRNCQRLNPL